MTQPRHAADHFAPWLSLAVLFVASSQVPSAKNVMVKSSSDVGAITSARNLSPASLFSVPANEQARVLWTRACRTPRSKPLRRD